MWLMSSSQTTSSVNPEYSLRLDQRGPYGVPFLILPSPRRTPITHTPRGIMRSITIDSRRPCVPIITPSLSRYELRRQARAYGIAAQTVENGNSPKLARHLADSIINP